MTNNEAMAENEQDENVAQEAPKTGKTPEIYEAEIAELKDKTLRALAECENVRRRSEIDIAKAREYSIESFAKDMVAVLDNLFRALDASPTTTEDNKTFKEGVELTKNEMINALSRHKITRIYPIGEKFNPNIHQAMVHVPSPDKEPDTIIEVMQAGYLIKDRVLRPALVAIAKSAQ